MQTRASRKFFCILPFSIGLAGCCLAIAQGNPDGADTHFDGPGKVCRSIVSLVEQNGGRVDWGINNLIAFDRLDPSTHLFQVWVMNPDGSGQRNVSSLNATLAAIDAGNPAWHPSGHYIALQAADMPAPAWASQRGPFYQRIVNPGAGFNNDLWLISTDGSHAAALSHLNPGQGVLHVHFSHSGDAMLWSELETTDPQKWVMHLAQFGVGANGPHIDKVQTLDPLGNAFYETHDFSPDDKSILFSTCKVAGDYKHMSIVKMDLATGKTTALTGSDTWNEHAHFSPDGKKIIWASSRDTPQIDSMKLTRNDYWIMNADGSDKRRLTFFNEPGAPEFRRMFNIASDMSWSPDGKAFVAYLQQRDRGEAANQFSGSVLRIALP